MGQVFFHPSGALGRAGGVESDDFLESPFGGGAVGAVEDAADGAGDFRAQIQAGDVSLGVLLEVELAALPGDGGKHRSTSSLEAGVIVAGDVGDAAAAALDEALEEGAPMHFGFAEGDADAQEGALAVGPDG